MQDRNHKHTNDDLGADPSKYTAAVNLQKYARTFFAKKKYGIVHLSNNELTSLNTYAIGNDPCMPVELNDYRELNDKIALIATSGFRAISLACQLGNTRNTPKIILIDNSKNVYKFWYAFREFTRNHPSKELFFENLPSFLKSNTHLCRQINLSDIYNVGLRTVQYPNQDITAYFNEMIKEYSYEHVRNIINHTTLIKQSWFDTATLAKIKNILNYLNINKIYVYPSNILSMTWNPLDRYLLLDNIKELSPVLSIHTDFCDVHEMPEKVSLYTNQCPTHIENSIFSNMICKQKDPKNFIQVT